MAKRREVLDRTCILSRTKKVTLKIKKVIYWGTCVRRKLKQKGIKENYETTKRREGVRAYRRSASVN